jgi:hypothetical protein
VARSFSFTGFLRFLPTWTEPLDLVNVVDSSEFTLTSQLSNGTAAGQANQYYRDVVTVAANTEEALDLTDLTTNVYGGSGTLSFSSVRGFLLRNTSASGSVEVTLGPLIGSFPLQAGGLAYQVLPAGINLVAIFLLNGGGSAVDIEIHLMGVAT